ncbi:MAG: protein kinase [Deltaproteobacteria bacterium]|nr:protein kinase [Deltaproteobacteria bacterium]
MSDGARDTAAARDAAVDPPDETHETPHVLDRTLTAPDQVPPVSTERTLSPHEAAARREARGDPEALEGSDGDALVGMILAGRYQLRSVLGRGGMGVVYEALHLAIGRRVAVKVLRRELARSSQAVERFQREARAAASIGAVNIVEVMDFGHTAEGDAYIAMELLEGCDLRGIVRNDSPIAPARALSLCAQVARGLSAAHARKIIHRDLKSENLYVVHRDGVEIVKILDFGISKITEYDEGRAPLTSEGIVMGTPHYMAPELLHGASMADERADVYALGCVLYELLTAQLPFSGRTPMEVAYKHVHEPVVPVSTLRPELSSQVDAVVLRALAKAPSDRFASADEMLEALESITREGTHSRVPESLVRTDPVSVFAAKTWLFIAAICAGAVGGTLALWPSHSGPHSVVARDAGARTVAHDAVAPALDARIVTGVVSEPMDVVVLSPGDVAAIVDSASAVLAPDVSVAGRARWVLGLRSAPDANVQGTLSDASARQGGSPTGLLPDVFSAPRGPDDGLKQTPYATGRGRLGE